MIRRHWTHWTQTAAHWTPQATAIPHLFTLCPMSPVCPVLNTAREFGSVSTGDKGGDGNAYRSSSVWTHWSHWTRLANQQLRCLQHWTRRLVTPDTAGPSPGVAVAGTRSPSIPPCEMKLEPLFRQRQVR
jgi:hypothetical protein